VAQGQATDIAIQAEEIIKMKKVLNGIYSRHTGQDVTKIGQSCNQSAIIALFHYDVIHGLFT